MKLRYMCLDSSLYLWLPGRLKIGFFASRIERTDSYVRSKPRYGQLAKMGYFQT